MSIRSDTMSRTSSVESQRIEHINSLMEELNEQVSDIYELLIDRDFELLTKAIDAQIDTLLYLRNSISDEP